jgi:hypothetical protein
MVLYNNYGLTRGEREFRALLALVLGVLFLDPRSWILVLDVLSLFLAFSFLAFGPWALLLVVLEVLG